LSTCSQKHKEHRASKKGGKRIDELQIDKIESERERERERE